MLGTGASLCWRNFPKDGSVAEASKMVITTGTVIPTPKEAPSYEDLGLRASRQRPSD